MTFARLQKRSISSYFKFVSRSHFFYYHPELISGLLFPILSSRTRFSIPSYRHPELVSGSPFPFCHPELVSGSQFCFISQVVGKKMWVSIISIIPIAYIMPIFQQPSGKNYFN